MSSPMKSSLVGSIHKIREFELEKVSLAEEFDILQIVGEGWFGKILLVEHKATDTEMVLKALPKPYTAIKDFYREFHYGLHLGVHKHVITTYDVAFETAGFYVFSQEYAPLGDLTSNVSDTGIGELHTKRVAKQLSSALEHLHTRDLVHRDIKLDNILVFKSDFSRIKLCDFGETRRAGSVVLRRNEWLPYAPPEVLQIPTDGSYMTNTSHDVWQFGIVLFVCLTGCLPWQKAASDDPRYSRYISWQSSTIPIKRQPKLFKLVSSKAQRLFKKYLEPKPEKRPAGLAEVHRFLDDRLLSKGGMEKCNNENVPEEEGLCPSMYSFHSSPEEKNKLLKCLTEYGLETTVDRKSKKDRIREWIQATVIEEEKVEDLEEEMNEEDIRVRDNQTGPIGERVKSRGPISEVRLKSNGHSINHTDAPKKPSDVYYTPPIDPRIPLDQQKKKKSGSKKRVQFSEEEDTDDKFEETAVNTRKMSLPFSLKNNLPFQNIKIYDTESSLNNNETFKHQINVQIPQSEEYDAYASPSGVRKRPQNGVANGRIDSQNGSANKLAIVDKNVIPDNKVFRAYGNLENKSSSSNSTGRSPSK